MFRLFVFASILTQLKVSLNPDLAETVPLSSCRRQILVLLRLHNENCRKYEIRYCTWQKVFTLNISFKYTNKHDNQKCNSFTLELPDSHKGSVLHSLSMLALIFGLPRTPYFFLVPPQCCLFNKMQSCYFFQVDYRFRLLSCLYFSLFHLQPVKLFSSHFAGVFVFSALVYPYQRTREQNPPFIITC